MEEVRLNKYLASCGVCSRREADKLIAQGVVTVNGKAAEMGQTVSEHDNISVRGKLLQGKQKKVVLAYYKPVGVTCSEKDAHAEKLITKMIDYPVRLTYAGRLDRDSEGLMLMTNDGELIDAVMRGSGGHEKEYLVKVRKELTPGFLNTMGQGVFLEELGIKTRECAIKQIGKFTFSIILTQGVNRQIRRMCKACGNPAVGIKRVRIMNIQLGKLLPNKWREITGEELETLYQRAGMKRGAD